MSRSQRLWVFWLACAVLGGVALFGSMFIGGPLRGKFLPGPSSSGHHQLELACDTCHTKPFGGGEVLQTACVGCHQEGLARSRDSHPARKFYDPRNADLLKILPVDKCVTCHSEHRPELTLTSGVTVKQDYCFLCHEKIAKDRPSHKDVSFDTCSSSGCHKYHDNRATYEKFIVRALDQPETKLKAFIKLRGLENPLPKDAVRLTAEQVDAPPAKRENAAITAEWLASRHAEGGVNCSGCHQPALSETKAEGENRKPVEASVKTAWLDKPDHKVCASCHATEVKGFTEGKHGMRLGAPTPETKEALFGLIPEKRLSPMKPELARLPMVPESHGKELGCTSCHGAHDSKTAKAQVEACLSCHNDDHSRAFKQSPHFALWESEQAGRVKAGEGVSCATCHMPRENVPQATGKPRIVATHNQNMNLRPNEKMARNVCLDCHGLEFTLNALADRALIQRNFSGRPQHHNAGFDWVRAKNGKPVKAAPAQTTPAQTTPADGTPATAP